MVWVWMLWSPYALGTRTESWFGHACTGHRMHMIANGIMVWAWMPGPSSALEHERCYGFGMHALVTVCSWNHKGLWFRHGCRRDSMLLEHELHCGLGADAVEINKRMLKRIHVYSPQVYHASESSSVCMRSKQCTSQKKNP